MPILCCRHAVYALALISAQYGSVEKYLQIKEDLKKGVEDKANVILVRPSSPVKNDYEVEEISIKENVLKEKSLQ